MGIPPICPLITNPLGNSMLTKCIQGPQQPPPTNRVFVEFHEPRGGVSVYLGISQPSKFGGPRRFSGMKIESRTGRKPVRRGPDQADEFVREALAQPSPAKTARQKPYPVPWLPGKGHYSRSSVNLMLTIGP